MKVLIHEGTWSKNEILCLGVARRLSWFECGRFALWDRQFAVSLALWNQSAPRFLFSRHTYLTARRPGTRQRDSRGNMWQNVSLQHRGDIFLCQSFLFVPWCISRFTSMFNGMTCWWTEIRAGRSVQYPSTTMGGDHLWRNSPSFLKAFSPSSCCPSYNNHA